MFLSLRGSVIFRRKIINGDTTTHFLYFLLLQNPSSINITRSISSPSANYNISSSFVVSYLMNSWGFSEDKAISASKELHFKTSTQPDSVIAFFETKGFTKPHISKIINKRPVILSSDSHKTLKPKFDFFNSIGLTGPDLIKLISTNPSLLKRSLENQILPAFDFLKSILNSNSKVVAALKRSSWILNQDLDKGLVPNIKLLRDENVPESNITTLLVTQPRVLIIKSDRFQKIVKEIKELGSDPSKLRFVLAIRGLASMSTSTWESKLIVYRKWGWSENDIKTAFVKQPHCMMTSEKKITATMDFFVNQMGISPSFVAKRPSLLMFSLEKRIIPRCLVIRTLDSKGLMEKNMSIPTVLVMNEKSFLERYVVKYEKEVPQIMKVYQCQLGFLDSFTCSK